MKKTILSVLLVLLLSFVLIGCKDEEPEEFDPSLPDDLKSFLNSKNSGLASRIQVPENTNFDKWQQVGSNIVYIAWSDADDDKWAAYKTKWGAAVKPSINARGILSLADATGAEELTVQGMNPVFIEFYKKSGTFSDTGENIASNPEDPDNPIVTGGFEISANTIVFYGVIN